MLCIRYLRQPPVFAFLQQASVKCAFTGTNGSPITPAAQECSVTKTDVGTEQGRLAFQCTNIACALDEGKKVWRLSLGYGVALTGIRFQQHRMYYVLHRKFVLLLVDVYDKVEFNMYNKASKHLKLLTFYGGIKCLNRILQHIKSKYEVCVQGTRPYVDLTFAFDKINHNALFSAREKRYSWKVLESI